MRKRIFISMVALTSLSLVIASITLCLVFYGKFSDMVNNELHNRAETFIDNSSQTAIEALTITKSSDMRVTVITPDGTVIFDNTAQTGNLPNHLDREEVRGALETGEGHSVRYSNTLSGETVYYAVRLTDGYVLRVSKTSSNIFGVFTGVLPAAAVIVALLITAAYLLTGRLTKRIVAPINGVNLESGLTAPYDELAPFVKTIARQRESMSRQLSDLQNRSHTISAIMDNMNEGIILTDTQGIILSANKSVLRILEKDSAMDGRNILEVIRDVNFSELVNGALGGKPGEMGIERAGRTYRVYFSHVKDGGAIILFLDITEKAKSEKLRREFSANVSHELKTPLTSIYGSAEMLVNGIIKENDKQAFYVQIKDEAGRLIALIDDILMISRLDEGGGRETFDEVDLRGIASEAAGTLLRKAGESNISVNISGGSVFMKANRALIYEMFYNLTDNAIKYNKPGGTVDIEVLGSENQIRITVADTGIGIPKEAQSRVFERFFRVEKSRSRKTGGTGLGLAIVKHIVLAHGGEITLKSRENEGSVVSVTFR